MSGDTHLQPRYVGYDPNTSHEHQMAEKLSPASRGSDKRREPRLQSVTVSCIHIVLQGSWTESGGRLSRCRRARRGLWCVWRAPVAAPSPRPGTQQAPGQAQPWPEQPHSEQRSGRRLRQGRRSLLRASSNLSRLGNSSVQKQYSLFSLDVHVLPVQRGRAAWPLCWRGLASAWPSFWDVESVKRFKKRVKKKLTSLSQSPSSNPKTSKVKSKIEANNLDCCPNNAVGLQPAVSECE